MTRHWRGEDGAHIWSSHHVTGAEGAWSGEVDVWGTVTLKVEGGGTYTAYVHEYMQFYEPCVTINRHYWNHKEAAIVDPNWTWGNVTDKTTFSWHLSGSVNNKAISADGHGYRQHHWGKGGKGFGEHGLPNLAWALAWEGHAGLHFFTRFPKGVTTPFLYALPEGFTVERKWWGQGGDHWTTTHDVRYEGTHINKRIQLVGSGFAPGSLMLWDGNKEKGAWIVKSWPQYAVATPKGDRHI